MVQQFAPLNAPLKVPLNILVIVLLRKFSKEHSKGAKFLHQNRDPGSFHVEKCDEGGEIQFSLGGVMSLARSLMLSTSCFKFLTRQLPSLVL